MNPTQFSKTPQPNTFKIPFIGGIFNWLKKIGWRFLLIVPVILVLGLVIFSVSFLVEPSQKPKNVFFSNVSESQATISWATTIPTKGIVLVSQDGKFPILPILADVIYKDDGEKRTKTVGRYLNHHVTVGKLKGSTKYKYQIYQGLKKVHEGEFLTLASLPSLSSPNPIYGQILSADKKPVVGALIYFQAATEGSKSATLSTLTNLQGRWSLDLANLRSQDNRKLYAMRTNITCISPTTPTGSKVASGSAKVVPTSTIRPQCKIDPKKITTMEKIIVEGGVNGRFQAATSSGFDKPWPTIILDKK